MRTLLEHTELLEKYLKEVDGDVPQRLHRSAAQDQSQTQQVTQLPQESESQSPTQSTRREEDAAHLVSISLPENGPSYDFDLAQLTSQDYGLMEDTPPPSQNQKPN